MIDVLSGFATIWVVIGIGAFLGHLGILGDQAATILSRLSFFVGLPPLMFRALSHADLGRIFNLNVVVSVLAIIVAAGLYLLVGVLRWHAGLSHRVIGVFCSCYVNANNMGLPIAAYVMKDTSWVAPILLIQSALLQPIGLTLLDVVHSHSRGVHSSWLHNVTIPVRNPMTIGVLAGLVANLIGWQPPALVGNILDLLAGIAVPCMLIAFGISLLKGPLPGRVDTAETVFLSVIKTLVQPVVALALARLFGLDLVATLAVVVMAGLPTAQNVFVFASRYDTNVRLARDVIFITTFASIPVITALTAAVHMLA
ncbi:AEC family transporter [Propionibacterium freudenreichii]|nr:AEC family transporter [Propionibacterium freudenreichii]